MCDASVSYWQKEFYYIGSWGVNNSISNDTGCPDDPIGNNSRCVDDAGGNLAGYFG